MTEIKRKLTTRRTVGIAVVLALIASMVAVGLSLGPADAEQTDNDAESTTDGASNDAALPTETVRRTTLTESKDETGTIDHGEAFSATIDGDGIVTARHDRGTVVDHGEPLIWLNNKPVTLAKGTTPMYRTLELIGSSKSKHQTGEDVRQLQEFLLSKGFDDKGRMEADGIFGKATRNAVKAWQKDAGLEDSGKVDRSQLMFQDEPVRIDSTPQIGAQFQDLQLTDATQRIKAEFDNKSRSFLPVGGKVRIDPDNGGIGGTITKVDSGVNDNGDQVLTATIEPDTPLPDDVDRVNVEATRTLSEDALVLPVRAVLALAGGGYGLEVMTDEGPQLRAVELGAVVDDLVEITGDVAEGDQVVVPNDRFGAE
ncbi:MAG: peptidoglycan-binding protein [Actinomycetota bacterium]